MGLSDDAQELNKKFGVGEPVAVAEEELIGTFEFGGEGIFFYGDEEGAQIRFEAGGEGEAGKLRPLIVDEGVVHEAGPPGDSRQSYLQFATVRTPHTMPA